MEHQINTTKAGKNVLFIFGAGASYDAGGPTQGQIFHDYFKTHDFEDDILEKFFQKIFLMEFPISNKYSPFPTFEEVLGILEFAIQNNASLGKDFPIEDIRILKEKVINLMAKTIKESLDKPKNNNHEILINNLFEVSNEANDYAYSFINLNYDILLDNALMNLYNNSHNKIYLDYGIELWRNFLLKNWSRPKDPRVYLLKPHGSLNWFYCPSCNSIYLNIKGTEFKKTEIEPIIPECTYCKSKQTLFIIPPTFFKTLTNVHITTILQNIQKEIVNSDYLVFIGYSFPDADLHLKYIIKKAFQFLSKSREIIVIEKEFDPNLVDYPNLKLRDVYQRYERIFKNFYFIPVGFEKFSKAPFDYIKSPSYHSIDPEKLDILNNLNSVN